MSPQALMTRSLWLNLIQHYQVWRWELRTDRLQLLKAITSPNKSTQPQNQNNFLNLVNTLRLRQNGWHFADNTFKCIFRCGYESSALIGFTYLKQSPHQTKSTQSHEVIFTLISRLFTMFPFLLTKLTFLFYLYSSHSLSSLMHFSYYTKTVCHRVRSWNNCMHCMSCYVLMLSFLFSQYCYKYYIMILLLHHRG